MAIKYAEDALKIKEGYIDAYLCIGNAYVKKIGLMPP